MPSRVPRPAQVSSSSVLMEGCHWWQKARADFGSYTRKEITEANIRMDAVRQFHASVIRKRLPDLAPVQLRSKSVIRLVEPSRTAGGKFVDRPKFEHNTSGRAHGTLSIQIFRSSDAGKS